MPKQNKSQVDLISNELPSMPQTQSIPKRQEKPVQKQAAVEKKPKPAEQKPLDLFADEADVKPQIKEQPKTQTLKRRQKSLQQPGRDQTRGLY